MFTRMFKLATLISAIAISSISYADDAEKKVIFDSPQELLLAASEVKTKFEEGVHYTVLRNSQLSQKKEVREFFSFFCGHCHAFLPIIRQVSMALPEDVAFVGNHVKFLGGPMGVEMQRAYASAVNLRVIEPFTDKVDDNFFNKHKVAQNHEDVVKIFEEIGISKEMFEAQYKSFPVMSAVSRYDQLSEDTGIEGVPTVVVNNKYKVLTEKINGTDEYMALINYLLSLDKDYYASGASSSKHE